uniref:Uncharacterized protein n=1 Tax=Stegastes partitus TaxID=144197 RepID=A0A3B4ZY54_9TELE
ISSFCRAALNFSSFLIVWSKFSWKTMPRYTKVVLSTSGLAILALSFAFSWCVSFACTTGGGTGARLTAGVVKYATLTRRYTGKRKTHTDRSTRGDSCASRARSSSCTFELVRGKEGKRSSRRKRDGESGNYLNVLNR